MLTVHLTSVEPFYQHQWYKALFGRCFLTHVGNLILSNPFTLRMVKTSSTNLLVVRSLIFVHEIRPGALSTNEECYTQMQECYLQSCD